MDTHHMLVLDTYDMLCNVLRQHTIDCFKIRYENRFIKEINKRIATTWDKHHIIKGKFKSENDMRDNEDLRKWIKVMLSKDLYDFNFGDNRVHASLHLDYISKSYNSWPAHTPKPTPEDVIDIMDASISVLEIINTQTAQETSTKIKTLKQQVNSSSKKIVTTIESARIPENDSLRTQSYIESADIQAVVEEKLHVGQVSFELFENNPLSIKLDLAGVGILQFLQGENTFLIGRSQINHLALSDPRISRRHLGVMLTEDHQTLIVDFDSTNGTFIDGEQLDYGKPYVWEIGSTIQLGSVTLKLNMPVDV